MSEKKQDKGKLFHKLHQLQKRITRWLKSGKEDKAKEAEIKEKKLLNRIKADLKHASKYPQ